MKDSPWFCESGNDSAVLFASLLLPEGQMGEAWGFTVRTNSWLLKTIVFCDQPGASNIFSCPRIYIYISLTWQTTVPKTNMDAQNDGLEKVTPFKNGNFGWFLGCNLKGTLLFSASTHLPLDVWFGGRRPTTCDGSSTCYTNFHIGKTSPAKNGLTLSWRILIQLTLRPSIRQLYEMSWFTHAKKKTKRWHADIVKAWKIPRWLDSQPLMRKMPSRLSRNPNGENRIHDLAVTGGVSQEKRPRKLPSWDKKSWRRLSEESKRWTSRSSADSFLGDEWSHQGKPKIPWSMGVIAIVELSVGCLEGGSEIVFDWGDRRNVGSACGHFKPPWTFHCFLWVQSANFFPTKSK